MTTLWAWRYSVGYGWRWVRERYCNAGTAARWFVIFQADEPSVSFHLGNIPPRNKPK